MKQIICKACIEESRRITKSAPKKNEKIVYKKGRAIRGMYCDLCARYIGEREVCYAKTVTKLTEKKESWESEYLK